MRFSFLRQFFFILMAAAVLASPLLAQDSTSAQDAGTSLKDYKKPRKDVEEKKELTPEERKQRLKAYKDEVGKSYHTWLDQDVRYIISPEEEEAFKLLGNDEEREQFIEQFWRAAILLRTPSKTNSARSITAVSRMPTSISRRASPVGRPTAAASTSPTGPPDEIESHASGGSYKRQPRKAAAPRRLSPSSMALPLHRRHRHQVIIEFVDTCMCNEYRFSTDPAEKDALRDTPNGGPKLNQGMSGGDRSNSGIGGTASMGGAKEFENLERYAKLTSPPPVKFKDLEEKVNTRDPLQSPAL